MLMPMTYKSLFSNLQREFMYMLPISWIMQMYVQRTLISLAIDSDITLFLTGFLLNNV